MEQQQRQWLHATLSQSSLEDIQSVWDGCADDYQYEVLRSPETGMVMAVGRIEAEGEPFNLGEVAVTRCALRLSSGETGIGYVKGRNHQHALHIALLDALAQQNNGFKKLSQTVLDPLQQKISKKHQDQEKDASQSRVDFLTMVRGES